jgi:multiple sugar transport system ATP-binding protein
MKAIFTTDGSIAQMHDNARVGRESDILLHEFRPRPALRVPETHVPRARVPAIDVHNHLGRWLSDWVRDDGGWVVEDVGALLALMGEVNAKLRTSMRSELARLHERLRTTTVYVTHDQVEAMTLGDRVAVLRDVVQQCDVPQVLFRRPWNLFVAAFIGSPAMNLVPARVEGGIARFAEHEIPLPSDSPLRGAAREVILGVRPTAFAFDGPRAEPDWPRTDVAVDLVEELGDELQLTFQVDAPPVEAEAVRAAADTADADEGRLLLDDRRTRFTASLDGRRAVRPGERVRLALDARDLHFFDPATGEALARDAVPEAQPTRS